MTQDIIDKISEAFDEIVDAADSDCADVWNGQRVSLRNNGEILQVQDVESLGTALEIHSPEIRFHTDDAATSIEVRGFRQYLNTFKLVNLMLV